MSDNAITIRWTTPWRAELEIDSGGSGPKLTWVILHEQANELAAHLAADGPLRQEMNEAYSADGVHAADVSATVELD